MNKISLEQRVAELTPEQKSNMGKIYKNYIISLLSVILVGVLLTIGLFLEGSIKEERAKDEYDKIQTMIELNETNNKYDFSLFDESLEALDEFYDMKQKKNLSFVIGSGVTFFGVLAVYFIFKIKYPYFSEKKYTYLKKLEKNSK
ncbi:MAG: hypothetical protein J6Q89_07795 [Clostridia bacterium]|nr:hypothetical protein [Clostridia bacterium]